MSELYPWQMEDWERLQRMRAAQGLLFQGQKGIGKLELAIRYAKSLLCEKPDDRGFACGECPACHWFSQGSHPDYRLLQPESEADEVEAGKKPSRQISVDQIRSLSDFLGMTAHQGGRRVVIISPAEAMNANAANALLKNLEEPPPGLLFILVTHRHHALLPTILSRCIRVVLSSPDVEIATRFLAGEGVKNPLDALARSGFSPLLALQDEGDSDAREKLMRALQQRQMDVFGVAEALQKTEQTLVVQWLQQWCHDLVSQKLAGRLRYHPGHEKLIGNLIEPLDALDLVRLQGLLKTAKKEARHTLNPRLFFESLLFNYCQIVKPCHT